MVVRLQMQFMEFVLVSFILAAVIIRCRGQSADFISIDCGYAGKGSYVNSFTGLTYVPDAPYIDTGENHNISGVYMNDSKLAEQDLNLRSFPVGIRNCYSLPVQPGSKYMIRTGFMYGNYDGRNRSLTQFDVYVGVMRLGTMDIRNGSYTHGMEAMVVASSKTMAVCLVNIGVGTPFISSLELRLLHPLLYADLNGSNYFTSNRYDMGSVASRATRYPSDLYDRMWFAQSSGWVPVNTSSSINSLPSDGFDVPSTVMGTAVTPTLNVSSIQLTQYLFLNYMTKDTVKYNMYMHFTEILPSPESNNHSRVIDIYLNGKLWRQGFTPRYLKADTVPILNLSLDAYNLTIARAPNSTRPPLLNAFESYEIRSIIDLPTAAGDVDAIMDVKSTYQLKYWMADPCVPQSFTWDGLNCSSDASPRITYINLATKALSGEISPLFAKLTKLTHLDLSGNNLTGSIPDALGELPFLLVLNLSSNHLSGQIPALLRERSANNSLLLSIDGNPDICRRGSCKKKSKTLVAVIASVAAFVVVIAAMAVYFLRRWRRNRGKNALSMQWNKAIQTMVPQNQQFTYEGLVAMTKNFEHQIGKGGFGEVYLGELGDGTQVAVKVRSQVSSQGKKEFQAEAQLLTRIHHKNIVSLVGYCNDDNYLALVYEHMSQGSLEDHLRGKMSDTKILQWIERLRIALESAQGLEYLHSGCKPPVVHRDVKSNNILLDDKRNAKIADFGLSKVFGSDETHVSTDVVGTHGYLDPEYYLTSRLTEKSDVFSFGIVLLELITGLPPIMKDSDRGHITHWVSPLLARGDIGSVVDDRMQREFDSNSVWKTVEIAMRCTRRASGDRPTMGEVVIQLKECLALETSRGKSEVRDTVGFNIDLSHSTDEFLAVGMFPSAR